MSVAVVVSGRNAHAVAGGDDSRLSGDVDETKLAALHEVVAKQAVEQGLVGGWRKQRLPDGLVPQHPPLHDEQVEVTVVVVVEEGRAGPERLDEVVLARHSVEVHELEPAFRGALDERRLS